MNVHAGPDTTRFDELLGPQRGLRGALSPQAVQALRAGDWVPALRALGHTHDGRVRDELVDALVDALAPALSALALAEHARRLDALGLTRFNPQGPFGPWDAREFAAALAPTLHETLAAPAPGRTPQDVERAVRAAVEERACAATAAHLRGAPRTHLERCLGASYAPVLAAVRHRTGMSGPQAALALYEALTPALMAAGAQDARRPDAGERFARRLGAAAAAPVTRELPSNR